MTLMRATRYLRGTYTACYADTNLGQLWQGPQNGTGTLSDMDGVVAT